MSQFKDIKVFRVLLNLVGVKLFYSDLLVTLQFFASQLNPEKWSRNQNRDFIPRRETIVLYIICLFISHNKIKMEAT